jgi:hypothetical protein
MVRDDVLTAGEAGGAGSGAWLGMLATAESARFKCDTPSRTADRGRHMLAKVGHARRSYMGAIAAEL